MPNYRRDASGLTEIQRDLTQAADKIAPRGTPLSLVALAARAGYPSKTVNKVVARLRRTGRWYWPAVDLTAQRRAHLDRVRRRKRRAITTGRPAWTYLPEEHDA